MLNLDGERAIPDLMDRCVFTRKLLEEALERYSWVKRYAPGRRILDIACGAGYGTRMLRDETKEAVHVGPSPVLVLRPRLEVADPGVPEELGGHLFVGQAPPG